MLVEDGILEWCWNCLQTVQVATNLDWFADTQDIPGPCNCTLHKQSKKNFSEVDKFLDSFQYLLNAYQQKWHIEVGLQSATASLNSDCQTGGDGGELAISSPLGMHILASGLEGLDGPTLRKNNYKQEALMMSQIADKAQAHKEKGVDALGPALYISWRRCLWVNLQAYFVHLSSN